jgi:gliding motility-associated-like protein
MKSTLLIIFLLPVLLGHSQTLLNQGGFINAQPMAYVHVNGSVLNDGSGILTVNGDGITSNAELFVSQNIENNAGIDANGYIRLLGDWIDNNSFISSTGTVFFEGDDQFLGGTAITQFFNLTLDGTGVKTQQIDKIANGTLNLQNLELNTDVYTFYVNNPALSAIQRTTGYISSANGGFVARTTQNAGSYLFPTGATASNSANTPGTAALRYRPVELTPADINTNVYAVRLANLDASLENYDRNNAETIICKANPLFYHQINRLQGTSNTDVAISFDPVADGTWENMARWNINTPNIWQNISDVNFGTSGSLSKITSTNWNNFQDLPYILTTNCQIAIPTAFTPGGDQTNETWNLIDIDNLYPDNKVFIYNRWGGLVYESKQGDYASTPWDGTFEGAKLPVASYYYIIKPSEEAQPLKGIVSIIGGK